jgi:hypothetical protein
VKPIATSSQSAQLISRSSSPRRGASSCDLKYLMFEITNTVSKKKLEMSSISISWGLIMILHIESDVLTSILVDLNGITHVGLG